MGSYLSSGLFKGYDALRAMVSCKRPLNKGILSFRQSLFKGFQSFLNPVDFKGDPFSF